MKLSVQIGMLLLSINCFSQTENDSLKQISKKDTVPTNTMDEIVVSASRFSESILKSPVSIEQLKASDAKNLGALSCFDALTNVKGVQVITPSLGFKVINTRGFANTTNVRFTQLVDGIDNQAPHIGAPIGNCLGANDLDIDKIEIIPGTASALYGLNAINGLANIRTKNPFENQGLSIQQLSGVNHVGGIDKLNPQLFSTTNMRFAKAINSKFAFKVNFSAVEGTDWVANNTTDLASTQNTSTGLTGANNPALDEANSYGNESPNRRTLTLNGKKYVVAKTGYREEDIDNYSIKNYKGDVGFYIRPKKGHELSLVYKGAMVNNIYQRTNRFRLEDYALNQFSFDYHTSIFQLKSYITNENTGKSYNIRSLAENMDRSFKTDDKWFSDYTTAFNSSSLGGSNLTDALSAARNSADHGRYIPETDAYNQEKNELIAINNWDKGAALRVKSNLFHAEGMLNWDKSFPTLFKSIGLNLTSGFDYREYFIVPDGNYFINPLDSGKTVTYSKSGGFLQASKGFWNDKLRISATLRADKADYFTWKYNPRLTAVYAPNDNLSLRASYQSGYRFPSIFEGFSNVNSGGVKRVGGLAVMSNGIFENSYTKSSIDAFQAKVISDVNAGGITQSQAISKNSGMLKKNPYTYLKPEYVKSFEIGVRTSLFKKRIFVDADFYYNSYDNFIAQVEASVPNTTIADSISTYLNSKTKQAKYRLWTNSQSKIFNYGLSLGMNYLINEKYSIAANMTYSKLDRIDNKDGLEDGFNTPKIMLNTTFVAKDIWKKIGASCTYRSQSKYEYVSSLVSGSVPSYWTLDAQVNYHFEKIGMTTKVGATNLLNKAYYSMLGGSSIGGMYYLSLVWQYSKK